MNNGNESFIPPMDEFIKGVKAYREQEERDAVYKISQYLIEELFKSPKTARIKGRIRAEWTTDAVGTFLLVWNSAFYRYGPLNFYKLQETIEKHYQSLLSFRRRDIGSFSNSDEEKIKEIFTAFAEATSISVEGKQKYTPVGVVKVLHLFAPNFFPLWDQKIAKAYKCSLTFGSRSVERNAQKYITFMKKMRIFLNKIKSWNLPSDIEATLKSIDEFNYAKYTKHWIGG